MVKDREAWRVAVHGVAELDTTEWLSNSNPNMLERKLGFQQTGQWFSIYHFPVPDNSRVNLSPSPHAKPACDTDT